MKKALIIIAILWTFNAHAQFIYSNQWAITAAGGVALNRGYDAQIGFDKIFDLSMHGIQARAIFYGLKAKTDHGTVNYQRYAFHINYALLLDQFIRSNWFFINITCGVVGGYDDIPKRINESTIVNTRGGFIAGLNIAPQFEFRIVKNLHCYIEPRFSFLFLSVSQNHDLSGNFGLKLYL